MALNVLVVDDSAVMRKMIIRALRLSGINVNEVFEAQDGQAGLASAMTHSIHLALLDVNMPGMNGLVLLEELRARPETSLLPIVIVSTEGSEERIDLIEERGAGFVRKPFTAESLVSAVVAAVSGAAA